MSWRNVIITRRCKLDYKMGYMVVRGDEVQRIYLDEIAVLMLENPAISLTGCLMEALTEKKIKIIFCDAKRSPVAEVVPYHGSHDSVQKIRTQIAWTEETKAAVWQAIIQEKICQQAKLLRERDRVREAEMLDDYRMQVTPGDATNREGHAAKVYFNALFGMEHTRRDDTPLNGALNYGYGILLSFFNREIAFNGSLTQLGIFHNNKFNHFNLSCDLMEPFRVLVDRAVLEMKPTKMESDEKHALWKVFTQSVRYNGSRQVVSNAIRLYTLNVLDILSSNKTENLRFYEVCEEE